jgi:soluble lytic murein transglycosylase-like protein
MAQLPRTAGRSVGITIPGVVSIPGGEGFIQASRGFANAGAALGDESRRQFAAEEREAVAEAQQEGQNAPVRAADGTLEPPPLRANDTAANRAFNAALQQRYFGELLADWRVRATDMLGASGGDPAAFRAAWGRALAEAAPQFHETIRGEAESRLRQYGAEIEAGAAERWRSSQEGLARDTWQREANVLRDELGRLAELEQIGTPTYAAAVARYDQHLRRGREARLIDEGSERLFRDEAAGEGEARAIASARVRDARRPAGEAVAMPADVPEALRGTIETVAGEVGLPPALLAAVVRQESGFRADARGAVGEIGLMQIRPETAARPGFGLAPAEAGWLDNPEVNLRFGARYLKALIDANGGDIEKALMAYNGGQGNVERGTVSAAARRYAANLREFYGAADGPQGALARLEADLLAIPGLSEQRRGRIMAQAAADIRRDQGLLQADREELRVDVDDATRRLSAGYEMQPDALRALHRRATALGETRLAARLDRLEQVQGTLTAAAGLSLPELQARAVAADEAARGEGADGLSAELAQGYRRMVEAKTRGLASDPLGFSARVHERTVGPLAPLDWASPNAAEGLRARVGQARRLAAIEGVPVPPLTTRELQGLKAVAADGTLDQQAAMIGTLARGLDPAALRSVLGQLATGDGARAFTAAAALSTRDPGLSREVLAGAARIRETKPQIGTSQQRLAEMNSLLGTALAGAQPETVAMIREAAEALYAERAARSGKDGQPFDAGRFREAVRAVTGEPVRWNGQDLLPPRFGMSQGEFGQTMERLTDADLPGARTLRGEPITADMVRRHGRLTSVGDGLVTITFATGTVLDEAGRALVLDLRPVAERPAPPVPPAQEAPARRVFPTGARRIEGFDEGEP